MTYTVTLTRGYQTDQVTLGILQIEGLDHEPIYTLENPWLGNKPYVSCIPAGEYICNHFNGQKYKDVYEVVPVEGRTAILIHHGNFEKDTSGCILVGMSAGKLAGVPAVKDSKVAMDYLRSLLGKKHFTLIIK